MTFVGTDYNPGITRAISTKGDSLTAGAGGNGQGYQFWLQQMFPDRFIKNFGIGGQLYQQIAGRHGGMPVRITLSGNAFNGDNPVSVTNLRSLINGTWAVNNILSTSADTTDRLMSGTINGVRAILKRTGATDTYTIRPIPASSSSIPADSVFVPDEGFNSKSDIQIWWWGRNNVPNNLAGLPQAYEQAIDYLDQPRRVLILGVLNGRTETTQSYNNIMAMNNTLRTAYPKNYVEITPPTSEEMAVLRFTPTSNDNAEIANGAIPENMRADNVHLNSIGYNLIANRLAKKLIEFGW